MNMGHHCFCYGSRKDVQMANTGVGKMNLRGPEAGMQLEEDQPATSLWSEN